MATIVIEKETRNKLKSEGRKDQTYDDIIMELLKKSKKSSVDSAKSAKQKGVVLNMTHLQLQQTIVTAI